MGSEPCMAYETKTSFRRVSSSGEGSTTRGGVRRFLKPPGPTWVVAVVAGPRCVPRKPDEAASPPAEDA